MGVAMATKARKTAGPDCRNMPKKQLISVVEDDQSFRESMGRLLRSLGFELETFASAAAFLASPLLAETACLISDINMPAMSGIELHRHLVSAGYEIPTILVTAYPDEIVRKRALNAGIMCYLIKPIDETELIKCLHGALRSGKSSEQSL
jgi:FixJ family two-component response regulator